MDIEQWKDIIGYEGLYQISSYGRVKSLITNKKLSNIRNSHGYAVVSLVKNKMKKQYQVHRLVAEHFIDNPNHYNIINHIDNNTMNSNMNNLEWCTQSHNIKYAYDNGRKKVTISILGKKGKDNPNSIPVNQYDLNNNFIKKWDCSYDVIRKFKWRSNHISDCCLGKRKSFMGYKWRYTNDI